MTTKTITISNIVFERNQMMIQVPVALLSDKQATDAYIRTWLFNNVALNYIAKVGDHTIILEKNAQQPYDLDSLDYPHVNYQFVDIVINQQPNYRCTASVDFIEMYGGVSQTAFHQLMHELPIEIIKL